MVAFGLCAIAWATSALATFGREGTLVGVAQHLFSGERYRIERLNEALQDVKQMPLSQWRSTALSSMAMIRLPLAEAVLNAGKADDVARALDDLDTVTAAALDGNPTSGFLWLTEYWLRNARKANRGEDLQLLRMSYSRAPNEGWIAVMRNPQALGAFAVLPDDLQERALSEFVGLVRSGFYQDAANILAGPGWAVRDKLLTRLAPLGEVERRRFSRALESKNLEGVVVPGTDARPSRPF